MKLSLLAVVCAIPAFAQLTAVPDGSHAQVRANMNTSLANGVALTGSYTNPSWLVSIPYSKVTGLSGSGPISFSGGVIGCVTASGSLAGCLSASDWAAFNAKQSPLGYTPLNAAGNLSDLGSVSIARTNLGLGTMAMKGATTSTAVQKGDGSGGLTTAFYTDIISLFSSCSGIQYLGADGACHTPASGSGSGTVTSVSLSLPSWLAVSGSPVTTSGTLGVTASGGQAANQFLATPNGTTGAVALRSIVASDIPTLNQNTTGTAAALASNGTNCPAGSYALGVDASGNSEGCTVAAGSGTVTSITVAATPSWLTVNNPTVTTTGTITLNAAGGLPPNQILATPNVSNGAVALRSLVPGDLPTIPLATGVSGTLQAAQEPAHTGDVTGSAGSLALNVAAIGGIAVPSGITSNTGSGSVVRAISPSLQGPALGTVASGDISAVTGTANSLTSGVTKALKSATTAVDVSLATAPTGGQVLTAQDSTHAVWQTITGTGTVMSVGLTVPSFLSVAGSPITGAGTLAVSTATGQTANQVLATPNGATGAAALRSLVPGDIPTLNQNTTGTATNVTGIVAVANGGSGSSTSTGSGSIVLQTGPTLVNPIIGAATATSINKLSITPVTNGSTLTIADGKSLAANNSLTFTGTDGSSVAFGAGGTAAYTGNNLGAFASTTSAQLAGVLSDETGSGAVVLANSPTLVTPALGIPSSAVLTNATGIAAGLTSGTTNALKSATTNVDVSAAAAPSSGQVLTAQDGTHATWLTPSGGGGGGGGISAVNAQTGTTYTVLNSDCGKLITFSNASPVAVTLPQAGAGGNFVATCSIRMVDIGAGTVTVTPGSPSLINGASPYVLTIGQGALLVSDGTNYVAQNGKGSFATQLDGANIGSGVTTLNILTGPDMTPTLTSVAGVSSLQYSPNGSRWATRDQVQSSTDRYCSPSSGSSSAYTCVHAHPLTVYTDGMVQTIRFDTSCAAGTKTVAMDSLVPKELFGPDGATTLTTSQCLAGQQSLAIYSGAIGTGGAGGWKVQTGGTSTSGGSGVSYGVDTGTTNSIIVTVSPAITYTAGQQIIVKVKNTNNGSVSINVNGIGSTTVYNSLGVALSSGALSANADYLLVYNTTFGGFEYAGTGACIPNGAGMTCNAAGGNYITMTGTTSGFRSYTTEAVGANDNVTIVGYNSTPTSGNCAQWSTSGGAPVLAQASAPCGTATATFVMPWGGLDAGRATAAKAANTVLYIRYDVPYPGRILNSIVAQSFSSAAAAHPSWAVYDASCTKVASGSSVTTPTFQQIDQFTFTPVTLAAGTYYFGVSSDAPDLTWLPSTGDGWGYGAQMANTGESASTYKVFTGSNPSTTASTTTTLPATCGTRTGITTAVVTIPFFSLQ